MEDAGSIARLALKLRLFALESAAVFLMYTYSMAVTGSIMVALGLGHAAGLESPAAAVLAGLILGLAVGTAAYLLVAGPLWRRLASDAGASPRIVAVFAAGFAAAYLPAPLAPDWYPGIAWFAGLALSLAAAGLLYWAPLAHAGGLMIASLPLVAYLAASVDVGVASAVASGVQLLAFTLSGVAALRRVARDVLGEA